jgi:two-component system, LuxR family, sensor kinase FixL
MIQGTPVASHDPEIARLGFEYARDILLVIDAQTGQILDANLTALATYRYTRDELLGRTIFDLRAADLTPVAEQMRRADSEGILFESLHQRSDGSTLPVEVSSRGHTIAGRRVLLSVVRDISARRHQEAERELMIDTTRRALALRDEFLAIASHELRSPVTNVSLKLQHIVRQLERAGAEPGLATATREALGETTRLATLISALLDAQSVAAGVTLARAPLDLAELVRDVAVQLRERAEVAGSKLEIDVPAMVGMWDRMRLEQVFVNLLTNALKYGQGRPIEVRGELLGERAVVAVRDHGIGIAAEDVGRVFEKFARAVPSEYGGFGLGLYIARQLVEAHRGQIGVASVPGEGTTFRVELPVS